MPSDIAQTFHRQTMSRERSITPAMTATMMTQIGTPSLLHIRASGIAVVTSYAHHRATSINTVHKN